MKRILCLILSAILLFSLVSCAAKGGSMFDNLAPEAVGPSVGSPDMLPPSSEEDGDVESTFRENPFVATAEQAISTFSADVDTASYSYFRKLVNNQYDLTYLKANGSSFRTEEFINYFSYEANAPRNGELFGVTSSISPCPWNPNTHLLRLTLQAEQATPEGGNNLVFLIDVSGSMSASDKLPLLKASFSYLVTQLTAADIVSIVTYSGKERVVLSGCPGNQGERILEAIQSLTASGSTNGQAGLEMAYSLAQDYYLENGNNRIIMASDGDLNVGISSAEELKTFVEGKRDAGIYLSVLGFGTGNYRDAQMEALADNGNGVYYYIDGTTEAERIFGTNLLSTLYTVAKDVKLQITFDPACVSSWRLIGYENRVLSTEDFTNDKKDAGEVGCGHQVTVCYELTITPSAAETPDWMSLAVRYKRPQDTASTENLYSIGSASYSDTLSADQQFIASVIEVAMLLHTSSYLDPDITLSTVRSSLDSLDLSAHPLRSEFRELVRILGEG